MTQTKAISASRYYAESTAGAAYHDSLQGARVATRTYEGALLVGTLSDFGPQVRVTLADGRYLLRDISEVRLVVG